MSSSDSKQNIVIKTIQTLNELRRRSKYLTIVWTKAHVGTRGNERADTLAKLGGENGPHIECGVPMCEVSSKISHKIYADWLNEWKTYREARMSKLFLGTISKKRQSDAMTLSRQKLGTLVRVITGHNGLGYFRNVIDKEEGSICRFCLENDETYWHLATDCPVFWKERHEIFFNESVGEEWTVTQLLDFAEVKKISWALEGNSDIFFEDDYSNENLYNKPPPEPD